MKPYLYQGSALISKKLDETVYPSIEKTVTAIYPHEDIYNGAHYYTINNCLGFENGETKYQKESNYLSENIEQHIQFIHKSDDGTVTPGVQSEQLVIMLIDRHEKLNARFPSIHTEKMLAGLQMFLDACRERVEERIDRGVMGELKK